MSTARSSRKSLSMQLATIRIRDIEVLSLACPRLDAHSGATLLELVAAAVRRGARQVVLDFGPGTALDFAGTRALEAAAMKLGEGGLCVVGLNARARAMLDAVGVAPQLRLLEWWTDAVDPVTRAA